ncbi:MULTISPECIES: extracellular solute-binding protein [unclassified Roseitalea]|uniref:extracellular solute-binding protein n=1 Tax=unclassified Roseitalea TaxID=2639107 RepID=UPI00273FE847|nr:MULTISPECIES: extracellular solute-binding protein [unclassified Roseitalea]
MQRKLILSALAAAVAAPAVIAATAPTFAQEISFWSWRQEDREQYEEIIARFEAQNPGVEVAFEAFEASQYATILSTALAADNAPDSMMVRAYGAFEAVANGGYLMPLDEDKVPALADFPQSAVDAVTLRSDGVTYAVPFASQTMLVMYNKAIFDDLGIDEPQTWDDLIAAAETITEAGMFAFANGTATAWQNETLTFSLGASTMGQDFIADMRAGEADFTDERFIEALEKVNEIKPYLPDGYQGLDYPSAQQLFVSGLAAMFAGGSFEIANFRSQNPDLEIGLFAAPGADEGDTPLVATFFDGGYAGSATTEHEEAVLKWLNFLATQEFGQMFANSLGNITPIPGVTFEDPLLQEVADLNANSIPYVMLTDFRYQEPSGSVLIQSEVQKMMAGEATPEEVGQAVTEGIATYHEPFQD